MYICLDSFRLMFSDLMRRTRKRLLVRSWLELMWQRKRTSSAHRIRLEETVGIREAMSLMERMRGMGQGLTLG